MVPINYITFLQIWSLLCLCFETLVCLNLGKGAFDLLRRYPVADPVRTHLTGFRKNGTFMVEVNVVIVSVMLDKCVVP